METPYVMNSFINSQAATFKRHFIRERPPEQDVNGLLEYLQGEHYISTRQAPSALLLKSGSLAATCKSKTTLLKSGFRLEKFDQDKHFSVIYPDVYRQMLSKSQADTLSSILTDTDEGQLKSIPATQAVKWGNNTQYKLHYEDPWKIHAARVLAQAKGAPLPELLVWEGDTRRLQDPLPGKLLSKLNGKRVGKGNSIRFQNITDQKLKIKVLWYHTHWGNALVRMIKDPTTPTSQRGWARTLKLRIKSLLLGKPDPLWKTYGFSPYEDLQERPRKKRSERFIELLKTVDGIFIQRYLCYPEEAWTWQRFDMFTLMNISFLIGDEFIDGELNDTIKEYTTTYTTLKRWRKMFKENAHKRCLPEWLDSLSNEEVPPIVRQYLPIWEDVSKQTGHRYIFLIGMLSQTRGCGTPPPLVVLQSKIKFLKTVSQPEEPISNEIKGLLWSSLDELKDSISQEAFTGLSTKGRVTVTSSASWEHTRREGGTAQSISDLVFRGSHGKTVKIINLQTGAYESSKTLEDLSVGEYIFWQCLDSIRRIPLEELNSAFLTVVKEPGKARSVTKARAPLKIVLDFVGKICAEPLKKGIRSSTSGMGKSHHGWNLFNELYSERWKDTVFLLKERKETEMEGYTYRVDTFHNLYCSSTDYNEATDRINHEIARILGTWWMTLCGVPPVLIKIVLATCYQPRWVYFYGSGILSNIGEAYPQYGETVRRIRLVKGILMGDPITKIVLHLTNVTARIIGNRIHDPVFLSRHFLNPNECGNAYSQHFIGGSKVPDATNSADRANRGTKPRKRDKGKKSTVSR
uniref:RNA-dependent RNA polymerase n=1 Tax=Grapevine-associated narna-like virus 6 TaxID=2814334 RepID=A0A8F5MJF5_9VIRU|nr:MAG: RNA-dependent RNA polymerase [Grapevine-associated narna-like virus 6]